MGKRRITQGERWQIIAHIKEGTKRISYKELTTEFNTTRNTSISQSTVRRILIKYKIGVYSALKKPLLRPYDKQRRLKWCLERRYWTIEQ